MPEERDPRIPTDPSVLEAHRGKILWLADWCDRVEKRLIKEGKLPPEGLVLPPLRSEK
jgi:hypothetical protein